MFALLADMHLRGKDWSETLIQLRKAAWAITESGARTVIVAGDLFDRSNIGDQDASTGQVSQLAGAFLDATRNTTVYLVNGNHDQAGMGGGSALHALSGWDHVKTILQPVRMDMDGVSVVFLPWSWAGDDPREHLTAMVGEGADLVVGHVQVVGAAMNTAFQCEAKPGKWQVSREFLSALPVKHFALGDFHRRQDLTEGRGGYIGALRQLNFGEEGNPQGFELWDPQTGDVRWIELDGAPRYRTVEVEAGDPLPTPAEGERLKIRIQGEVDREAVIRAEDHGALVEQVVEASERVRRADIAQGVLDQPQALVDLWAENQEPPLDQARKARMLALLNGAAIPKREAEQEEPLAFATEATTDGSLFAEEAVK